jgi:hypothetical protein
MELKQLLVKALSVSFCAGLVVCVSLLLIPFGVYFFPYFPLIFLVLFIVIFLTLYLEQRFKSKLALVMVTGLFAIICFGVIFYQEMVR